MRLPLFLLALVLLAPLASAETLANFEEPRKGVDALYPFTISNDEANEPRAVIFRNAPTRGFGLILYDDKGEEVWIKNGTRGVQTFPGFPAGNYRFFIRGDGWFQVADKFLDRKDHPTIPHVLNTTATLEGTDAYVIAPSRNWTIDISGNVSVEYWDMTGISENLTAPFNRTARLGSVYVLTVRGEEGAPYSIGFTPVDLPPPEPRRNDSPAPALPLALGAVAAAFALVRFRRRT